MRDHLLNTITTGDCRELSKQLPDASIDLIFTDPPHINMQLFAWLANEANRVLRPGGFLLTYTGQAYKDNVMCMLYGCTQLKYFWDFVELNEGSSSLIWQRKVIALHKSILCYTRQPGGKPTTNVLSVYKGGGKDKRFHTWGQSEQTARYFIECFSRPGETVYDPFSGGGTTPAVCRAIGRPFVAFEIDGALAEQSRTRRIGLTPMDEVTP